MCGIAGLYNRDGRPVDLGLLEAMTQTLAHRGPDGEGYALMTPGGREKTVPVIGRLSDSVGRGTHRYAVGFGHRRLAIIDPSPLGHQPMASEDGQVWITYNGEIYNYRELRAELTQRGHRFRSGTDTEVVLQAYCEWGDGCLSLLNGMFAFALWDGRRDRLFCARDRFGIKPFYYRLDGDRVLFASEIKALLKDGSYRPAPDARAVYDYLVDGRQDHTDGTFFAGIRQLKPGHLLSVQDGAFAITPWWEFTSCVAGRRAAAPRDDGEVATEFRERFEDAIRLHLRSDVPVGSCLSGGLDSSSIVCTAHALLSSPSADRHAVPAGGRLQTFSSCFDDAAFDERPYMHPVVKQVGADAHEVFPDGLALFDELPLVLWHQDEPFAGMSILAQWAVMRAVGGAGVKVVLDGQGADELCWGYPGYLGSRVADLVRTGRWAAAGREWADWRRLHGGLQPTAAAEFVRGLVPDGAARWLRARVLGYGAWVPSDFASACQDRAAQAGSRGLHDLTAGDAHMVRSVVQDLPALLHYEDRNSMAFSVEARVPFLDHRLGEWLAGLSPEHKIRNGMTKVVMRDAMTGVLPERVRQRTDKMGFVVPQDQWLRVTLRSRIEELLSSERMRARPYWRIEVLRDWYRQYCQGRRSIGPAVWRWINLESWLRRFCD
jgi:asparagine synthase (glutamine-hydrolysing)